MRIYISHSYGKRHGLSKEEYTKNVYYSIYASLEVLRKGHNPFIPNLYHFVSEECEAYLGEGIPEERWLELVCEWLRFCDALFVAHKPTWENSGVDTEIKIAEAMGIPIYWKVEDIPIKD